MNIRNCWYKDVCPETCYNNCIRFLEMTELCRLSNLPESRWKPSVLYPDKDYEAYIELKHIKDNIKQWVQDGNSLYIYSEKVGNGKTSWAIKLMLSYFNQIWPGNAYRRRAIFISVPSFITMNKLVMNENNEEFRQLRNDLLTVDLVVWDDIAATKLTDYDHAMLLTYIDQRKLAGKSNIYTSNADEHKTVSLLGARLASRVWNDSTVIEFISEDKRGVAYDRTSSTK